MSNIIDNIDYTIPYCFYALQFLPDLVNSIIRESNRATMGDFPV